MEHAFSIFSSGAFGAGIGILGLAVAIYTFIKTRQYKSINCEMFIESIVSSTKSKIPKGIEIFHNGISVKNLYRGRNYIWNDGNTTISNQDIVKSDLLRLQLDKKSTDGEIIIYSIVKSSNQGNDFQLKKIEDGKSVIVDFDYFDPKDGICIELFYTGSRNSVHIYGSIKGMNSKIANLNSGVNTNNFLKRTFDTFIEDFSFARSALRKIPFYATFITGFLIIFISLFSGKRNLVGNNAIKIWNNIRSFNFDIDYSLMILGLLYALFSAVYIFAVRRKFPKSLIP